MMWGVSSTEQGRGRSASSPLLVVAAVLCWLLSGFALFQMSLIAGNEAIEAQFDADPSTPTGVFVAAVIGGLALAAAFVAAAVTAARRGGGAVRTAYLLAGGGLLALGLMLLAMTVQQWSSGQTIADAAAVTGETTFPQGLLGVTAVLLIAGAVASALVGLLRRSDR